MPRGQLYINGQDAYLIYGVSLDKSALSILMTPPPLKDMIENESRLMHGRKVFHSPRKIDARTITITFNISASSSESFMSRYASFCDNVLNNGEVNIKTSFQPDIEYHFDYLSCQSFNEWRLGIGKFTLRLIETNPANRVPNSYA